MIATQDKRIVLPESWEELTPLQAKRLAIALVRGAESDKELEMAVLLAISDVKTRFNLFTGQLKSTFWTEKKEEFNCLLHDLCPHLRTFIEAPKRHSSILPLPFEHIGELPFWKFIKAETYFRLACVKKKLPHQLEEMQRLSAVLKSTVGTEKGLKNQLSKATTQIREEEAAYFFIWYRAERNWLINTFRSVFTGGKAAKSITGNHWVDLVYRLSNGLENPTAKMKMEAATIMVFIELKAMIATTEKKKTK